MWPTTAVSAAGTFDSLNTEAPQGLVDKIPSNAVVGNIRLTRLNIFDEDNERENAWLYRTVNKFHMVSRKNVVSSFLLFEEGSPFRREHLDESERILRSLPYLYDARIFPSAVISNSVDLQVITRDVWSLEPIADFSRQGGESASEIGIQDSNLFGSGKSVMARYTDGFDRDTYVLGYGDPNLLGSRFVLSAQYGNSTDGDHIVAVIQRPFFSLDSKWTAGLQYSDVMLTEKVYSESIEINRFDHVANTRTAFAGVSQGLVEGKTRRLRCGFTYRQDTYSQALSDTEPVPEDRTLGYPWVELSQVHDRFSRRQRVNFMHLTEDINLGPQTVLRMGWSSPTWGADVDDLVCYASHARGFAPRPDHLLLTEVTASGYWNIEDDLFWDTILNARARYYCQTSKRAGYYAGIDYTVTQNLRLDKQITLGGSNGMRGYPLRYQSGDRRFLLTLEKRHFTGWDIARIFRIGAVAFADVGMAWDGGAASKQALSDIGIGIRLSPTRAYIRNIIHLDIAAPLADADDLAAVQFSFTVESRF